MKNKLFLTSKAFLLSLFFLVLNSHTIFSQTCCSSPMPFPNGNFETTIPAPNDQFNDSFAGFPASFMYPTGSGQGITGNTAVPTGYNFADSQNPGNKANYLGMFYVNSPSNKFVWARGNSICINALGVSIGTLNACHKYKVCVKTAGWSPSFLSSTPNIPDGKTEIRFEATFVRFSGGNVKIEKSMILNAATDFNNLDYQYFEFEFTTPSGTFGPLSAIALTVNDANDGAIFDDFAICDLGASTTAECTVSSCTLPSVSPSSAILNVGTCNGSTANNDAQISFSGLSNTDKADIIEGVNYTGNNYSAAVTTTSGGSATFNNLKHDTNYTIRFFNASNGCFHDIVLKTPSITCVAPCSISAVNASAVCNDAGTGNSSTDDFFTLTTNPTSSNCGTQYNVEVTHNGSTTTFGPYNYGAASPSFGNFLISGGSASVKVTDVTTSTATQTLSVDAPATCSTPTCSTPNAGADITICLPKTTLDLTDATTENEWVAVSGNPAMAVINATTGTITGMTATGVYSFRLQKISDATCGDVMTVTVTNGDTPIILCDNGSTSYTLIAQSGLTNVVWYNMAGTQVGTAANLIVTSNTTGLSDGSEAFYYIGEDGSASGCDVQLCCPVKFITQTCCPTPNCGNISVIKN